MMITANQIYDLVNSWKNLSFLHSFNLQYIDIIYNEALSLFEADYKRWYPQDNNVDIDKLIYTPQLHAILTYRLARLFYVNSLESNSCMGGVNQQDVLSIIGRNNTQMEIFYSANIGGALKINHGGGTVIGARCKIGSNCTIHQNVTIGEKSVSGKRPTIGDNVMIYAGSKILGDITIGNNCIIGANSVVLQSFPDNSVIAGIPAKNIK